MYWMLAREILMIKGKISRQTGFILDDKEIMPDLYFYRDPADIEREEAQEAAAIEAPAAEFVPTTDAGAPIDFNAQPEIKDWAAETAHQEFSGAGGEWNAGPAAEF